MEPKPEVKTFVFFDLEATGLYSPGEKPPRITELCMLSVQREELLTRDGIPRIVNKITICVDPEKPINSVASQITGLYNDGLETQSPFNSVVMDTVISFLSRLPKPVCLLAHYGNGFDFRLLASETERAGKNLPPDILCADSIEFFRGLEENVTAANDGALNLGHGQNSTHLNDSTTPSRGLQINASSVCDAIKQKARQLKRKASYEAHASTDAKAVRKRLFDTATGDDINQSSDNNTEPTDLGVSMFDSGAARTPSSSTTIFISNKDVEQVKQRLMFDSPEKQEGASGDADRREDAAALYQVGNSLNIEGAGGSESNVSKDDFNKLGSQHSITDEILVAAVTAMETQTSNHSCTDSSTRVDMDSDPVCVSRATLQIVTTQGSKSGNVTCSVRSGENLTATNSNNSGPPGMVVDPPAVTPCGSDCGSGQNVTAELQVCCNTDTVASNTNSTSESSDAGFVTPLQAHQRPTESSTPEAVRQSSTSSSGATSQCQASDMTIQAMDLTSPNHKPSSDTQDNSTIQSSECTTPISKPQSCTTALPIMSSGTNMAGSYPTTPVAKPKVSFKLEEIYRRTFGCKPPISHTAEDDCVTLMKVAKRRCPQFTHWVDDHALPLKYVMPFF